MGRAQGESPFNGAVYYNAVQIDALAQTSWELMQIEFPLFSHRIMWCLNLNVDKKRDLYNYSSTKLIATASAKIVVTLGDRDLCCCHQCHVLYEVQNSVAVRKMKAQLVIHNQMEPTNFALVHAKCRMCEYASVKDGFFTCIPTHCRTTKQA